MEVKPLKLAIIAIALCQFQTGVGKSKKPESFETVSVKNEIEPIYPGWAYQNGIGEGFARVAFYVDENGVASDFLVIEYSHKAFATSFLNTLRHWDFEPAYYKGQAIKSVAQAYWEFLPDRAIVTNALFDTSKRIEGTDAHGYRELDFYAEKKLDSKLKMVAFPEVIAPASFDTRILKDSKVKALCEFYIDTEGSVALPMILDSSVPALNDLIASAFKSAVFERPLHKGMPAVALMRKTYLIHVTGN